MRRLRKLAEEPSESNLHVVDEPSLDGRSDSCESQRQKSSKLSAQDIIARYGEEDEASVKRIKKQRTKKGIRISNRLFAEVISEEGEAVQWQGCQPLAVQRRVWNDGRPLLDRMCSKVDRFRSRLQFKGGHSDPKFLKEREEGLRSTNGVQEVEILVGVPKVLGGRLGHAEAALYLKNVEAADYDNQIRKERQSCVGQNWKGRKDYYEWIGREIKLKRVETLTGQALRDCFKKSALDESDYIKELEMSNLDNNLGESYGMDSQGYRLGGNQRRQGQTHRFNERNSNGSDKVQEKYFQQMYLIEDSIKQSQKLVDLQPADTKFQMRQTQISVDANLKQGTKDEIESNKEDRYPIKGQVSLEKREKQTNKKKNHKKGKKRQKKTGIRNYIEEQAEESNDGNGDKSQSEDSDGTVTSLIDDDVEEMSVGHMHQKYFEDMCLQEEKELKRIKEDMKRRRQARQRWMTQKLLIEEKAGRGEQREDRLESSSVFHRSGLPQQQEVETEDEQANEQKLRTLELQLGVGENKRKKVEIRNGIDGERLLRELQSLSEVDVLCVNRPERRGLKHLKKGSKGGLTILHL